MMTEDTKEILHIVLSFATVIWIAVQMYPLIYKFWKLIIDNWEWLTGD